MLRVRQLPNGDRLVPWFIHGAQGERGIGADVVKPDDPRYAELDTLVDPELDALEHVLDADENESPGDGSAAGTNAG